MIYTIHIIIMSYTNFLNKLTQYSKYEDIVALKLTEKYNFSSEYIKCITNEYNFKLSNEISYELKCDVLGANTNNCFVEHWGYGK